VSCYGKRSCTWGDRPNINCGLRVGEANKIFEFVKAVIDRGDAVENLYTIGEVR